MHSCTQHRFSRILPDIIIFVLSPSKRKKSSAPFGDAKLTPFSLNKTLHAHSTWLLIHCIHLPWSQICTDRADITATVCTHVLFTDKQNVSRKNAKRFDTRPDSGMPQSHSHNECTHKSMQTHTQTHTQKDVRAPLF